MINLKTHVFWLEQKKKTINYLRKLKSRDFTGIKKMIVNHLNNTHPSQEEKAIKNIEKLIQIPDHEIKITDEIKESLKLAVEKLKEVK